ncbi:hypothetical protein CH063_14914, partial [Colletotrichum higginsianum]
MVYRQPYHHQYNDGKHSANVQDSRQQCCSRGGSETEGGQHAACHTSDISLTLWTFNVTEKVGKASEPKPGMGVCVSHGQLYVDATIQCIHWRTESTSVMLDGYITISARDGEVHDLEVTTFPNRYTSRINNGRSKFEL